THVKPHGALSNMACENYELSFTIAKAIKQFDPNIIFLAHAQTEMEKAGRDLNLRIACEVFADRNYEDNGYLVARSKSNAMILGREESAKHVLRMLENQALNCYSGKQIPCDIDSICVHGDEKTAVENARYLREVLIKNGFQLKSLDKLKKLN
ncbi:MAG: LamB/YcsF family protein, partial [Proteobacteria bacterium]|nr:LamB/YcsF family protein [Pseudomonadota bacterium]NCU63133.1 LamB/YcsF family protein [Candidatus Fonsibacter lacus]NDF58079.1 LamB/YcsF family protein [Pseudomonadota bacterium]